MNSDQSVIKDRRTLTLVLLAAAAVSGLGLWLISPRFSIAGPSLIDDWAAISRAPGALRALLSFDYVGGTAPEVDAIQRYRPAYTAIWNSLQWRVFGAPGDLTWPNVLNGLRIWVFAFAFSCAALAAADRRAPPALRRGALVAALAAAPAALILATPAFPTDFARLGSQEPIILGALTGGLLLLLAATARCLGGGRALSVRVLAPGVAGYLLWALAIYTKEVVLCIVVAAPFLYLFLDRRWRERGLIDGPLWRRRPFQVVTALAAVPLIHLALVVARIAGKGTTAYGSALPQGGGWLGGLRKAVDTQLDQMSQLLATPFWRVFAFALPVAIAAVWIGTRRAPWLPIGLVAAGWSALAFQGLAGVFATRYYMPTLAAFALAGAILLIDSPPWAGVCGVLGALAFVVNYAGPAKDLTVAWAAQEKADIALVAGVTELNPSTCPVYTAGLDIERKTALPVLVALRPEGDTCLPGRPRLLLQVPLAKQVAPPFDAACAPPGFRPIRPVSYAALFLCRRVADGRVPAADGKRVTVGSLLEPAQVNPARE